MKKIKFFIIAISFSFLKAQEAKEIIIPGEYSSIYVYQGIDVNLIKGKLNKIVLTSNNKDASAFGYKIKNGVLKLRQGLDRKLSIDRAYVNLYSNKPIEEIKLFQGGILKAKEPLAQTSIKIKVQEGSSLEAVLDTEKTTVEVFSGGSVDLKGKTTVIEIIASTGGICSSEELDSKQAKVKASLGSLVYARASLLFDANASTGSTVRVYEKPKKTVTKTSFGGKIIMMK